MKWRVKRLVWKGKRCPMGIKMLDWQTICIVETREEAKRVSRAIKADGYDNGHTGYPIHP